MDEKGMQPAYVAWRTFLTAVEELDVIGLPDRIDRSVFRRSSGTTQVELLHAFRFLGLIDEDSQPTPILRHLVEDPDLRPITLKGILQQQYRAVFDRRPESMTSMQLTEAFKDLNINNSQLTKSIRFFLRAAEFANVPLSPLLQQDARMKLRSGSKRPRSSKGTHRVPATPKGETPPTVSEGNGQLSRDEVKRVVLRSGGTLAMTVTTVFVDLSSEDRDFVFGLLDKLSAYENAATANKEQKSTGA